MAEMEEPMTHRLAFIAGFGAGYVLGARAGRDRYDQIRHLAREVRESPAVQETAGVLQAQASNALGSARKAVSEKVSAKVGGRTMHHGGASGNGSKPAA
jgi:hypothetical protein